MLVLDVPQVFVGDGEKAFLVVKVPVAEAFLQLHVRVAANRTGAVLGSEPTFRHVDPDEGEGRRLGRGEAHGGEHGRGVGGHHPRHDPTIAEPVSRVIDQGSPAEREQGEPR